MAQAHHREILANDRTVHVVLDRGDWHFGYRVEDGYWGFLEIIGEDEGNRARRKPGKDLYGTVAKYSDRKGE
ncbi:MAG: hypothetical protein HN976_43735 [Lentisphaerae bacterium]|nr:hypothetical protein [Lentisphaerota bacterium]MBT7062075.1 hypothetical protein [Lentisphaerota bacterium]